MHIDFIGLQAFLAVIECGSFQSAATHLNISQAAVSHRLKKLEQTLGVELLARTTRQVALTEVGRALLPKAKTAIKELSSACEMVRKDVTGSKQWISFACMPTMVAAQLPRLLSTFAELHPDAHVRLYDNSIHEIAELVESRTVSFGITVLRRVRGEVIQTEIAEEPFVLVCPKGHRLSRKQGVTWRELQGEPLIRIALPFDNELTIDESIGDLREALNWRYETQRHAAAMQLVRAGLGLAVIPKLNLSSTDTLRTVAITDPPVKRKLSVVTRSDYKPTKAEQTLLELFVRQIRDLLPE